MPCMATAVTLPVTSAPDDFIQPKSALYSVTTAIHSSYWSARRPNTSFSRRGGVPWTQGGNAQETKDNQVLEPEKQMGRRHSRTCNGPLLTRADRRLDALPMVAAGLTLIASLLLVSGVSAKVAPDSRFDPGAAQVILKELHTITSLLVRIRDTNRNARTKEAKVKGAPITVVQDCSTLYDAGVKANGIYRLFPYTFNVYCDMNTDGGGWTVIQRRMPLDLHTSFVRNWADYRRGFGNLETEFWLGLEALHQLTYSADYELRIDMVDFEQGPKYAKYEVFQVGPEEDGYRLLTYNYSGNAGDALSVFHSGRKFSTIDKDQDLDGNSSCAVRKKAGWWFHACYSANPNGFYPSNPIRKLKAPEIRWWQNNDSVLVLTEIDMKIRRRRLPGHHHVQDQDAPSSTPSRPTSPATTVDPGDFLRTPAPEYRRLPLQSASLLKPQD
ncbi:techylectin-5B-like isoform X2 [Oratosquilla oratoria]|uniref:techylectin-5B-like isoform X2 n=1 Tax=Oratosquilla oratoria TaxID=337810 RepID=UPI003F777ECF